MLTPSRHSCRPRQYATPSSFSSPLRAASPRKRTGAAPAHRITEVDAPHLLGEDWPSRAGRPRIRGVIYFAGLSFAGSGLYASDLATDRARLFKQLETPERPSTSTDGRLSGH